MAWIQVRIGNICEQIRGVTYSKSESSMEPSSGMKPVLRANNITDTGLISSPLVYVPETRIKLKQFVRTNDILIAASSGSLDVVGKAALSKNNFDGGFGAFCKVLRPTERVDPHYVAHYFKTSQYRQTISSLAAGANINNLKNEHLDNLIIPLPPLPEQKRIAAILDQADALREKRLASIAKLDELLQSVFLDMFGDPVTNPKGWETATIDKISIVQGGLQLSSKRKSNPIEAQYLRVANVYRGYLVLDEIKTMNVTEKEYHRTLLQKGDILVVEGHGNPAEIGRCAVWEGNILNMLHQNHLIRIRPSNNEVESRYLSEYLNSEGGKRQMNNFGKTTSGLNTISVSNVRSTEILLPPKLLQIEYVNRCHDIEGSRKQLVLSLSKLENLFYSLQQRAFRGEL